jgi:hypothetical protein
MSNANPLVDIKNTKSGIESKNSRLELHSRSAKKGRKLKYFDNKFYGSTNYFDKSTDKMNKRSFSNRNGFENNKNSVI